MNRYTHVLKLALRNLMAQRLRSLLTVLGIVLGVASVIIMLAVGEAARFEAIEQIRQLAPPTSSSAVPSPAAKTRRNASSSSSSTMASRWLTLIASNLRSPQSPT
ncbi:MAG: ABC transporter permease [Gemmatales bacterium]